MGNPLTIPQLADRIKAKYPAYSGMDDTDLVNRVTAKYPQYKSMLATDDQAGSVASQKPPSAPEGSVFERHPWLGKALDYAEDVNKAVTTPATAVTESLENPSNNPEENAIFKQQPGVKAISGFIGGLADPRQLPFYAMGGVEVAPLVRRGADALFAGLSAEQAAKSVKARNYGQAVEQGLFGTLAGAALAHDVYEPIKAARSDVALDQMHAKAQPEVRQMAPEDIRAAKADMIRTRGAYDEPPVAPLAPEGAAVVMPPEPPNTPHVLYGPRELNQMAINSAIHRADQAIANAPIKRVAAPEVELPQTPIVAPTKRPSEGEPYILSGAPKSIPFTPQMAQQLGRRAALENAVGEYDRLTDMQSRAAESAPFQVRDARRIIGKPLNIAPPSPKIDDAEELPAGAKPIEAAAKAQVTAQYPQLVSSYITEHTGDGGKLYVNSDSAKPMINAYGRTPEEHALSSAAVHNSSAAIAKGAFENGLIHWTDPTSDTVNFVTGMQGTGKTHMAQAGAFGDAGITYERNMGNLNTARDLIEKTLDAGKQPVINVVVPSDPLNSLDQAITRLRNGGHGVQLRSMAAIYHGVAENVPKLKDEFGDNLDVRLYLKNPRQEAIPASASNAIDILRSAAQNQSQEGLYNALKQRLDAYRASGQITDKEYEAFSPLASREGSGNSQPGASPMAAAQPPGGVTDLLRGTEALQPEPSSVAGERQSRGSNLEQYAGRESVASEDAPLEQSEGKPTEPKVKPPGETNLYSGIDPRLIVKGVRQLQNAYQNRIAEPLINKVLHTGPAHGEVGSIDPVLAEKMRALDAAPGYYRAKAEAAIKNVTQGLSPAQERLFTLMADKESRDNLQANHPEEYIKAMRDPDIQRAILRYRPIEAELTAAHQALGGNVLNDNDYLRRVYTDHTSGIGKAIAPGERAVSPPFDRVITPQRPDLRSRQADAEHHYQHGLHEFGPAFGTKYVGTMLRSAEDDVAQDFLSKATKLAPNESQPPSIEYNGQTFYRPDVAKAIKEARPGAESQELARELNAEQLPKPKSVKTYSVYDPTEAQKFTKSGDKFLGPETVVDELHNHDKASDGGLGPVGRFVREQEIGLGFGVPHMMNIARRMAQSSTGSVANPAAWIKVARGLLGSALKTRALSGTNDEMFDRLAKYGGISPAHVESYKAYWGGNLNPANWMRVFAKVGHDYLFKPGGIDQRARLYVADMVKQAHPEISDDKLSQLVNDQIGRYNRQSWTKMMRTVGKAMLFPGWDFSSINWAVRHPLRTTVPPAILTMIANGVINSLGANKYKDRNDFSSIHYGNRSFTPAFINESLAKHVMAPALQYADSRLHGEPVVRAAADASRKLPSVFKAPLGMALPPLLATAEDAFGERLYGGNIIPYRDRGKPGSILPSKSAEDELGHIAGSFTPEITRARGEGQQPDLLGTLLGNAGLYSYRERPTRVVYRSSYP